MSKAKTSYSSAPISDGLFLVAQSISKVIQGVLTVYAGSAIPSNPGADV